jgi:hypothetical protein
VVIAAAISAALAFPLGTFAGHQFADVPNSNIFHGDIAAISGAGITSGCGGGNYCPKEFVTREQMAAFLNRLGALAPEKTPVVNADRLDGLDAEDLTRVASITHTGGQAIPGFPDFVTHGTVSITAPAAGWIVVNVSATVRNEGCTNTVCHVAGNVRHNQSGVTTNLQWESILAGLGSMSWNHAFPVNAGVNSFSLRLQRTVGGNGTLQTWGSYLTAQYVPFNGVGQAPSAAELNGIPAND